MELESLLSITSRRIQEHEELIQAHKDLKRDIQRNESIFEELTKEVSKLEEVRIFLQELAEAARAEIASGLEQIVTLCLQSVFGDSMSFEIEIDTSHNSTAVSFYVLNEEGNVRSEPKDSVGGGVVDVIAAGLRFGLLKILNPAPIGPIILDEPGKMVSASSRQAFAELIYELTHMFKKQNIMITHDTSLMQVADHSIYIEKVNGVSRISSSIPS
jgi:DNA repair ATPase RecN